LSSLPSYFTPRLLPVLFTSSHFATTLILSLINHHTTYILLVLPFLQSLLTYALSATYTRTLEPQRVRGRGATEGGWRKVENGGAEQGREESRRAWKVAAAETVGTVCRIIGSRENQPWVWATIEVRFPFFSLLFLFAGS
jgi:hypothetical protein